MVEGFTFKEKYTVEDLRAIMTILRRPDGCPWDREQTHESIRRDLIEETYEVIEAINKGSAEMLAEELGDLLMQVVFHAEIEREKGVFDFDDVADGICKKLILRHPHVFGEVTVSGTDEVLKNWDAIKMATKRQKTATEAIESIPRELPALMRAEKVQKKAAKVGFDWPDVSGAFQKICEETAEVKTALADKDPAACKEELGDLLFAVVNVCRFAGVDAEEALTAATDKFSSRFSHVEKRAGESGRKMEDYTLEELDRFWEEAKHRS